MTDVTQNQMVDWLRLYATTVDDEAGRLTQLDSAIGDADHGTNLSRGMRAVAAVLDHDYPGIGALTKKVGMTLVSTVGGASGPLYGTFFIRFATVAGSATTLSAPDLGRALRAGVDGVVHRGRAEPGDKTMVDVWLPAMDAYDAAAEQGVRAAMTAMSGAAAKACEQTRDMRARKGRASYLGERSRGHVDPGAASTALLIATAARTLG